MKGKRFLGVLLALMIVMSCFALSASAADDVIYDAKKPLALNIHLYAGTPGTAEAGTESATGIADVEGKSDKLENPIAGAVFTVTTGTGDAAKTVEITTDENGLATAADLTKGRYTVHQKTLGTNQSVLLEDFEVDVPMTNPTDNGLLYTVDVYPKVRVFQNTPTITKKVSDKDADYRMSASIMSYDKKLAYWKITINLPENIENYKALVVTDILEKRLINPSAVTAINNAEGEDKAFAEGDYSGKFDENGKLVLTFAESGIKKMVKNTTVDLKYTTEIDLNNPDSIAQKIGNHVVLEYTNAADVSGYTDNTPDTDGDDVDPSKLPEDASDTDKADSDTDTDTTKPSWPTNPGDVDGKDDPYVWTGALDFTKIKKGDEKTTLNAEFQLYNAADDKAIGSVITTTDGKYSIKGLAAGKYYLVETKAPKGYELIGAKIPFEITGIENALVKFTPTSAKTIAEATESNFSLEAVNYIVNIPTTDLPLTGGAGAGVYALAGAALALVGFFLCKSKKVGAR